MIKCPNCNQFIEEKDKFCKYCGCPTPHIEEVKPKPKTEKQLYDQIQLEKTVVTADNIDAAMLINFDMLHYKIIGDKNSVRVRNIIVMSIAAAIAVTCLTLCFLLKSLTNQILAYAGLIVGIMLMFFCAAVAAERFSNLTMLAKLEDRKIFLPKYGLKKTPLFLLGGSIFKLYITTSCPMCDGGDIIGDLHVERIDNRPVAVCNYNRKHVYYIAEQEFFDRIVGISTNTDSLPATITCDDQVNSSLDNSAEVPLVTDNLNVYSATDIAAHNDDTDSNRGLI